MRGEPSTVAPWRELELYQRLVHSKSLRAVVPSTLSVSLHGYAVHATAGRLAIYSQNSRYEAKVFGMSLRKQEKNGRCVVTVV